MLISVDLFALVDLPKSVRDLECVVPLHVSIGSYLKSKLMVTHSQKKLVNNHFLLGVILPVR